MKIVKITKIENICRNWMICPYDTGRHGCVHSRAHAPTEGCNKPLSFLTQSCCNCASVTTEEIVEEGVYDK